MVSQIFQGLLLLLAVGCICLFNKFFFVGVELLYNVVLVSAVQQSESAICTYMPPLLLDLLATHGLSSCGILLWKFLMLRSTGSRVHWLQ